MSFNWACESMASLPAWFFRTLSSSVDPCHDNGGDRRNDGLDDGIGHTPFPYPGVSTHHALIITLGNAGVRGRKKDARICQTCQQRFYIFATTVISAT